MHRKGHALRGRREIGWDAPREKGREEGGREGGREGRRSYLLAHGRHGLGAGAWSPESTILPPGRPREGGREGGVDRPKERGENQTKGRKGGRAGGREGRKGTIRVCGS